MITRHRIRWILVLAVMALPAALAAAQSPDRVTDKEMKPLLESLEKDIKQFQDTARDNLKKTTLDTGSGEASVAQYVADLRNAARSLKNAYGKGSTAAAAEDVFRRAGYVNRFMTAHPLVTGADKDWTAVKLDLDRLARAYGVAWDDAGSSARPNRVTDRQLQSQLDEFRKAADRFRNDLDKALAGDLTVDKKMRENVRNSLKEIGDTANRLKGKLTDPKNRAETSRLVGDILRTGEAVGAFMENRTLPGTTKIGWARLRAQVGAIAAAFNVAWK